MLIRKLVIVFGILIKRVKLSTDDNDINVNNNRIVTPRKSRTLGHIADIFLSAHCLNRDCERHADRASFCCRRNFNPTCCFYLNHNNQSPYHPPYSPHTPSIHSPQHQPTWPISHGWNQVGPFSPPYGYWPPHEKPGSCPPAKYPTDYHDDYYSRDLYGDYPPSYHNHHLNNKENLYYPELENIRRRRKSINPSLKQQISNLKMTARLHHNQDDLNFQKEIKPAAYKVLKVRRRGAKNLDLHPHQEIADPKNNRLIPEILTPILNGGGYPGSVFGHTNGGTCRYDHDCYGQQKCCHVQVGKYRFQLGCRFPRYGYYKK